MFGHIREDLLPDVVEESRNRSSALAVPEFLLLARGRQLCERGHCTCAKGDAGAKMGQIPLGPERRWPLAHRNSAKTSDNLRTSFHTERRDILHVAPPPACRRWPTHRDIPLIGHSPSRAIH